MACFACGDGYDLEDHFKTQAVAMICLLPLLVFLILLVLRLQGQDIQLKYVRSRFIILMSLHLKLFTLHEIKHLH